MKILILLLFILNFLPQSLQARIRLRKVKEAPKVCAKMTEDPLLSRPDKKVLSTLRHSLVFDDGLDLVKDKGEKVCHWRISEFESLSALENFNFFIDEYKDILYAYAQNPDQSYLTIKIPTGTCSLENKVTQVSFDQPKCDKPKKTTRRKKKKA